MAKSKSKSKSKSTSTAFDQRRHKAQNARAKAAKRSGRRAEDKQWVGLKIQLVACEKIVRDAENTPGLKEYAASWADTALDHMRTYPKYKYTNTGKKHGAGKWMATR